MLVTFKANVSYGKLDSVSYDVTIDITEEDYERLKASAKEHIRMIDDPEISDIYDEAYQAAIDIDYDVLIGEEDILAEKMAWYLGISEEEAAEREYEYEEIIAMLEAEGERGIGYPADLEEERDFCEDEE